MLRYRGESSLRAKFGYFNRESLASMTNTEAQEIIKVLASYEFPLMQALSVEYGLFKTYGIETISKLLVATGQLAGKANSPKRYEDTAVLIGEFMMNSPTSRRTVQSISRMNYLHSSYRKSGQITNEDMLYTLSVFVTEPPRFARLYDWRPLNEMEYCAFGVFWKAIGDAMGIEYIGYLARAEKGWRDGVEFAEDITTWAKAYEIQQMKPSKVCSKPAKALIPMMIQLVPGFLKPVAAECINSLLGERVRDACMLPEPHPAAVALTNSVLSIRRTVVQYLALPRLWPVQRLADKHDKVTGRLNLSSAQGNHPFYVKPTIWKRWGPSAWAVWLLGGKLPGDDPEHLLPEGYLFEEVGPSKYKNMGKDEMAADAERMLRSKRGGCPFSGRV
ncbi:hypothetical protein K4F52_009632 [Lecanicillium sp. MT-2017a]|nr:hypothetical protein K4F52_009632 [Lecanicillium sp. MT-2017a]